MAVPVAGLVQAFDGVVMNPGVRRALVVQKICPKDAGALLKMVKMQAKFQEQEGEEELCEITNAFAVRKVRHPLLAALHPSEPRHQPPPPRDHVPLRSGAKGGWSCCWGGLPHQHRRLRQPCCGLLQQRPRPPRGAIRTSTFTFSSSTSSMSAAASSALLYTIWRVDE